MDTCKYVLNNVGAGLEPAPTIVLLYHFKKILKIT